MNRTTCSVATSPVSCSTGGGGPTRVRQRSRWSRCDACSATTLEIQLHSNRYPVLFPTSCGAPARCLDRDIISVEEAEAAAEAGDDVGDRVRLGISAAVLLSAAVRSATTRPSRTKRGSSSRAGTPSSPMIRCPPRSKRRSPWSSRRKNNWPRRTTAPPRSRVSLCRDLVRAAIDGGSKASSPLRRLRPPDGRRRDGRRRTGRRATEARRRGPAAT